MGDYLANWLQKIYNHEIKYNLVFLFKPSRNFI